MATRYEVRLCGRLPQSAVGSIRSRCGDLVVRAERRNTVLTGTVADQAALRALLELIWDTGAGLLSLSVLAPDGPADRGDSA